MVKPIAKGICDQARQSFVIPQINRHLDYLENELSKAPWFAGSAFSAADIQMSFLWKRLARVAAWTRAGRI